MEDITILSSIFQLYLGSLFIDVGHKYLEQTINLSSQQLFTRLALYIPRCRERGFCSGSQYLSNYNMISP